MHIETATSIPDLHNDLWTALADGYGCNPAIPKTYMRDLYPWLGDHKALRDQLDIIFLAAPYDETMQACLDSVYRNARPFKMNTDTTTHLIWLTANAAYFQESNERHRVAYRTLDRFIDSLDIIISAHHFGIPNTRAAGFLSDPQHHLMFTHLGAFMRTQEQRLQTLTK